MPARKGARRGAGAGSPRPQRPHLGHTGRGTLAARSRGQAAGGGTAPDTRCSHNAGRPPPPGTAPHQPCGTQPPQVMQAKGTVLGPHTHTPAPTARGWRSPNSLPSGRAVRGGTAPDLRSPSQWWKAPPPGTPFRHPHSEQRRPARAHAVGQLLGPHARTDRTRDTRVAEPWLPAPVGGQSGEGQRLTPDAPHNSGRPTPPGTACHHPRGTQPPQGMQAKGTVLGPHTHPPAPTARGWRTPTARPVGGQSGEGQLLTSDAPHTMVESTPPGEALPPSPQRATPARNGARCGVSAGSPRPHRPRPGHTGRGTLAARSRGRAVGGGTAPDTRRPSQRWQATPPRGRHPTIPAARSPRRACRPKGTVLGPHTHTPAPTARGWRALNSLPSGRAVGGETASDLRRPSQWWKAPPPGTPFRRPHSEQRRPARAHAVGSVLGPHARTDRTRDTRVAEPWPPAPQDGRPGEGQHLTPDAPHNGGRHPPRGRPSATPTASNAGHQGRTLWNNRCWVPTPAPTAPGTHGSRYPSEAVWGASPIPAAQPVVLFARPDQEFSC